MISTSEKDVLWPLLYQASAQIDDEYWQKFFVDLSKGKSTKRIYMTNAHVTYNNKRTSFSYKYDDKSPFEIANELKKLISETLCLFSKTDMSMDREDYKHLSCEFKDVSAENNWKKIKTRKMKDHLIFNYVIAQKEAFNLHWAQAREAYELINNSLFVTHTIKSKDINMNEGEIVSINGIQISSTEIINYNSEVGEEEQEEPVNTKVLLNREWVKLCTGICKKSMQYLCMDLNDKKLASKQKVSRKAIVKPVLQNDEVVDDEALDDEVADEEVMDDLDDEIMDEEGEDMLEE
jgi:hypothetical protein